jgi:excinuclease ABC subunit A
MDSWITIKGARTHNLKQISTQLPRNQFVVITGLSGSGKSSLAFDTLYAEGQRRYVESLSSYARQFLSLMEKPDVDHIAGLSPAVAIEQKKNSHNPRSTVGTITEIYDYLRVLFARIGTPHCPTHQQPLTAQTVSQIAENILSLEDHTRIMLLAPIVDERKGEHQQLLKGLHQQGYIRFRIDGNVYLFEDLPTLDAKTKHSIEVVVDRLTIRPNVKMRLTESLETVLSLTDGKVYVAFIDQPERDLLLFSSRFACLTCGFSLAELEPKAFSFNSPHGACPACDGLGRRLFFDPQKIIVSSSISIAGGAIRGWDKSHPFFFQLMEALATHYDFDLEAPYKTLSPEIHDVLLYGSGKTKIAMARSFRRRHTTVNKAFEGVIPMMERRYLETESDAVKQTLTQYQSDSICQTCEGARINPASAAVTVDGHHLKTWVNLSIERLHKTIRDLKLSEQDAIIAKGIQHEVLARLHFLNSVGLNYLSLGRTADTLSGGESQRIRLASQIGSGLVGVLYVLDEPSIGLHQRDNQKLLDSLKALKDLGNTVVVVEHDEDTIRQADYILDLGPGAGKNGGEIMAEGSIEQILAAKDSLTGQYLRNERSIALPKARKAYDAKKTIKIMEAEGNNLKQISCTFPVGLFTVVTGVSGSGKSTLVNETLYPALLQANKETIAKKPLAYKEILGAGHIDKIIRIDQSPIGRTPRSNPATYTGIFTPIRERFAATPDARARGYSAGRFSFNVSGGRCEACEGNGLKCVEMHFLADVYVTCEACHGSRYNEATRTIRYKGHHIADILNMTVEEALPIFESMTQVKTKLDTLIEVGLGYIKLGQSATTLSGGEAQRIKLAKELAKRSTGKTLYLLDEPTTGLHVHDVKKLLDVLMKLRDQGNTIIVIEHHLDVIKMADWIIDLGPEGGEKGGALLAEGTPERISQCKSSHTGIYLKQIMKKTKSET